MLDGPLNARSPNSSVRRWLIDIPALLFSLWWTAYRCLLIVLVMVSVSTEFVALTLRAFGIRWGW
jgi:hypothetical protein